MSRLSQRYAEALARLKELEAETVEVISAFRPCSSCKKLVGRQLPSEANEDSFHPAWREPITFPAVCPLCGKPLKAEE